MDAAHFAAMFGQAPTTESDEQRELARQLRDLMRLEQEQAIAARRTVLAWGAILCACRKRFDWDHADTPPQANCQVHGSLMVTVQGEVLLRCRAHWPGC